MTDISRRGEEPKLQTIQDIMTSDSAISFLKYKLPSEFFEKVLECEVNLKEKFDPKIFFDLINYYSKAIEFYESINDPKFIIYNQALNFLFEQPEAKKFMAGKDLAKEFRKKEIVNKFKQCDKVVTEEKVKLFIEKRTNAESIKSSIDNLYNGDMEKQKNSFKKKMEEKRLKYNDKYKEREESKKLNNKINNNNDEVKTLNENKENIKDNENVIKNTDNINDNNNDKDKDDKNKDDKDKDNKEKEEKVNDDEFKIGGGDELLNIENEGEEQEEISDIDFNFDDVVELVNIAKEENKNNKENNENKDNKEDNNNKSDDKIDLKEEPKPHSDKNTFSLKKSIKMTNKTRFFEKIKENFDGYCNEYYEYFINKNIDTILKDFEDNSNEIIKNVCESGINYLNQIKDMEYLLDNKDTEESYRKEIGNIIKQLEDERDSTIDKIISENITKLKNNKYSVNNTLLKEKLKLDATKLLNSFVFK